MSIFDLIAQQVVLYREMFGYNPTRIMLCQAHRDRLNQALELQDQRPLSIQGLWIDNVVMGVNALPIVY